MANRVDIYDVYLNGEMVISGADSVMFSLDYGKGEVKSAHGGGKVFNYMINKIDDVRREIKFKVPLYVGSIDNDAIFRDALKKRENGLHTIVLDPQIDGRKKITFTECGLTDSGEVNVSDDQATEVTFQGIHQVA